jgi:hypothetical protein
MSGVRRWLLLATLGLAAIEFILLVIAWLPGGPVFPTWLTFIGFGLIFVVFPPAMILRMRAMLRTRQESRQGWFPPRPWARNFRRQGMELWGLGRLPRWLKVCLVAGFITATASFFGAAAAPGDVEKDEHGYYLSRWDNSTLQLEREPITAVEYEEHRRNKQRQFAGHPVIFSLAAAVMLYGSGGAAPDGARQLSPQRGARPARPAGPVRQGMSLREDNPFAPPDKR